MLFGYESSKRPWVSPGLATELPSPDGNDHRGSSAVTGPPCQDLGFPSEEVFIHRDVALWMRKADRDQNPPMAGGGRPKETESESVLSLCSLPSVRMWCLGPERLNHVLLLLVLHPGVSSDMSVAGG